MANNACGLYRQQPEMTYVHELSCGCAKVLTFKLGVGGTTKHPEGGAQSDKCRALASVSRVRRGARK